MGTRLNAISPVIATVIIVAVAIAIAVAVVGWLIGLWSGLAGGTPQISVTNIKVYANGSGTYVELYITNAGSGSDKILRAELIHGTTVVQLTGMPLDVAGTCIVDDEGQPANDPQFNNLPITVQANCRSWLGLYTTDLKVPTVQPGDSVTIKLYFDRSGTQTIQAVVSPG